MKKDEFLRLLDDVVEEEPGTLTGSEQLADLEGWDSMATLGYIAVVDEQFDLAVPPERLIDCQTVDDLIALLGDHITE